MGFISPSRGVLDPLPRIVRLALFGMDTMRSDECETVAQAIDEARSLAGFSISRLCRKANVARPTFYAMLGSSRPTSGAVALRLAEAIGEDCRRDVAAILEDWPASKSVDIVDPMGRTWRLAPVEGIESEAI